MPDFEQKIQHCYHNQFFVTKDMRKENFRRSCLERINLSWFVTTLSAAKTKHLPGILNCRHFDAVCFYGNIMAPIPSGAEITQATNIFFDVDIVVKNKNVKIEIWFIVVCTLINN